MLFFRAMVLQQKLFLPILQMIRIHIYLLTAKVLKSCDKDPCGVVYKSKIYFYLQEKNTAEVPDFCLQLGSML
jgi:hypothetical protein